MSNNWHKNRRLARGTQDYFLDRMDETINDDDIIDIHLKRAARDSKEFKERRKKSRERKVKRIRNP